jgi:hypothetical protein
MYLIVESLSHTDSTTREVWIIILSFPQDNSCRSITVASEQGKYIVLKKIYCYMLGFLLRNNGIVAFP